MDTDTPQADGDATDTTAARAPVEPPDDPRVPQPSDAEPERSKELGGAAPAVGPRDQASG